MNMKIIAAAAVMALGMAAAAWAQPERPVAVLATVGAATGSKDTGVAVGGAVHFDIHPRLTIEGEGTFLQRGRGSNAVSVAGNLLVNLLPASDPVVPYAVVGAGMYHVSFDLDTPRYLGTAGTQFPAGTTLCAAPGMGHGYGMGPGFGTGTATCTNAMGYWGVGAMPAFYASRLGAMQMPAGGMWGSRSFTDPAVSLGGGVRFNLTDRVVLKPDARVWLIMGDGDTQAMGVFTLGVGVRF